MSELGIGPDDVSQNSRGRVTSVNLRHRDFPDELLAHLTSFPFLSGVTLNDSPVTDACIEHLLAVQRLSSLWVLRTKITPAGIARIERAKPSAMVFSRPGQGRIWVGRWPDTPLDFVPSAVEGLPSVTDVAVFSDRLELLSDNKWTVIRFRNIARWNRYAWLCRPLARLGFPVLGHPSVADRDWFHPPAERFFRFYGAPAVTVYMPDEPEGLKIEETMFRQVQSVIHSGGYCTFDLG